MEHLDLFAPVLGTVGWVVICTTEVVELFFVDDGRKKALVGGREVDEKNESEKLCQLLPPFGSRLLTDGLEHGEPRSGDATVENTELGQLS